MTLPKSRSRAGNAGRWAVSNISKELQRSGREKADMDTLNASWMVFPSLIALCFGAVAVVISTVILLRKRKFSPSVIRVVGFLTIWMATYYVVEFSRWIIVSAYDTFVTTDTPDWIKVAVFIYWLLGKFTALLTFSLMALYLVHAKRSKALTKQRRTLYQIGFVLLPFVTMPIYYLKGLLREPEA